MHLLRVKVIGGGPSIYHCISRIVGGKRYLDNRAKEVLRRQIGRVSVFCGVEVLTYCIMSSHFHLLIRIPEYREVADEELLVRFSELHGESDMRVAMLAAALREDGPYGKAWRRRLLARMGDISILMKELKQRFSIWYNRSHGRFGTLWAERFRSVLVEGRPFALQTVAAYIDLNPVRAGLCQDPKHYRFCGYAEASGGSERARRGIQLLSFGCDWKAALESYRMAIFGKGSLPRFGGQPYIDPEKAKAVLKSGGKLSTLELLRCRVRYFNDGAVLGSSEFVQEQFEAFRKFLSEPRKSGPRTMRGGDWGGLTVLRDLQKDLIT